MSSTQATDSIVVPSTLSGRLRHYRERAGLTKEQAAVRSGRGFRTLEVWERGVRTPSVENLRQLAALYGVPVVDLLGEDDHGRSRAATVA